LAKCAEQFAQTREPTLEDTLKTVAVVASAVTALVCAVSLMASSGEAKTHHKKPAAAAATGQTWTPPPGSHDLGGPMKSGKQCWKDRDPSANTGQGYWGKC
jgi:hypothetical protein